MGLRFLLDTNAVIYLQKGLLAEPLPTAEYFISVITEMELLSFAGLDAASQRWLSQFIDAMEVIELTDEVKQKAIEFRREYRLKLPDAIIAASAVVSGAILLSNDASLISRVPNLDIRILKLQES